MAPRQQRCRAGGEGEEEERLGDRRGGSQQEDRVQGQQQHRQGSLPGCWRQLPDNGESGKGEADVGELEGSHLVPAGDPEHRRREEGVGGQPGVLHPEQRIGEVPCLDQVGGEQPVLEGILEGIRPLRQRNQQRGRRGEHEQQRPPCPDAGQCVAAQPAHRQNLERLDCAV